MPKALVALLVTDEVAKRSLSCASEDIAAAREVVEAVGAESASVAAERGLAFQVLDAMPPAE